MGQSKNEEKYSNGFMLKNIIVWPGNYIQQNEEHSDADLLELAQRDEEMMTDNVRFNAVGI